MRLKWSSAKWRPFCLGRNVLSFESAALFTGRDTPSAVNNTYKQNKIEPKFQNKRCCAATLPSTVGWQGGLTDIQFATFERKQKLMK